MIGVIACQTPNPGTASKVPSCQCLTLLTNLKSDLGLSENVEYTPKWPENFAL